MKSYFWIKLHHAVLDDPKMGLLPDSLWRRVIELFLLAGEKHEDGVLPPLKDMVWRLHTTHDGLEEELGQLSELGIVEQREGGWFVTHFARLQAPHSSGERSHNHRERQRRLAYEGALEEATCASEQRQQAEFVEKDRDHDTSVSSGLGTAADHGLPATERPTDQDVDTDGDPDSAPPGRGRSARDPPCAKPSPPKVPTLRGHKDSDPLTDGQRRFLELFGASRFRNGTQKDTIRDLEKAHGLDALLDKGRWAAKLGMGLGRAVVAVESAFKNERSYDGRNGKRSTGSGARRGRGPHGGVDAGPNEEVQRGLTRGRMDAKLARLERVDGGAGTAGGEDV